MHKLLQSFALPVLMFAGTACSGTALQAAQPTAIMPPTPSVTWADLADLADSAPLVVHAQVRKQVRIEPERAPGVRPGWARFYFEANTISLLAGDGLIGESLRYLGDLPLDANGNPPSLKRKQVFLFASQVASLVPEDRSGELRLVTPDAQVLWDPVSETRLRAILPELLEAGAPPHITGVREAINVAGELAGQSETQIFFSARDSGAAAISVTHRPGSAPAWGVSFSEVAENGKAPPLDTLRWYRLACFLPPSLPRGTNLSESPEEKAQAEADYKLVMGELGACPRLRR
ncbi:MAG: hypothetical protein ABIM50_02900 [Novosphingobium sp.]